MGKKKSISATEAGIPKPRNGHLPRPEHTWSNDNHRTEDMLSELMETKPVVQKSTKKVRPTLDLTKEEREAFKDWATAKSLNDLTSTRELNLKEALKDDLLDHYIGVLWEQKAQPTNPALVAENKGQVDCEGIFIIQDRYRINMPQVNADESPASVLLRTLVENGLSQDQAKTMIENEIDMQPQISLRSFRDLTEGSYVNKEWVPASDAEKEVGRKILAFVTGREVTPLTAAERALVVLNEPKTIVKKGFLERVCIYCSSKLQLANILKIIKPQESLKLNSFGQADSLEGRKQRMLALSEEILNGESNAEEDDDNE